MALWLGVLGRARCRSGDFEKGIVVDKHRPPLYMQQSRDYGIATTRSVWNEHPVRAGWKVLTDQIIATLGGRRWVSRKPSSPSSAMEPSRRPGIAHTEGTTDGQHLCERCHMDRKWWERTTLSTPRTTEQKETSTSRKPLLPAAAIVSDVSCW